MRANDPSTAKPTSGMTIGRQVLAGYIAILVLTLVVTLVATGALNRVSDAKDKAIARATVLVAGSHRLEANVADRSSVVRGFFLTRDQRHLAELPSMEKEYDTLLVELQAAVHTDVGRGLLERVVDTEVTWRRSARDVADAVLAGVAAEEIVRRAEEGPIRTREELSSALRRFVEREETLIRSDVRASDRSAARSLQTLWVLSGLALAVAMALATIITRRVSTRLASLSRTVDGAASNILAGTTQQVAGFSEQAAAGQETVATVEELVQTAQQSAQRARMVADRAQRSAEVAQEGIRAVEGSAQGMEAIRAQVDSIAQGVVTLAERAQAVSHIVDTVNEIAEQTHLLALNAAIEAARAGEHGRGFGVVAAEVKGLADQSRRATAQVNEILREIQRGTNSAVMLTEAGTKSVSEGMGLVARAGDTITELSDTVAEATVAAEQIAASSNQQAVATSQISQAMKEIDSAMEQNLASARQAEQTARELDKVAAQMRALVGAKE